MHGEEYGHEKTAPHGAGGPLQQPKQQQNVGCMQYDIDEVMSSGIQAKQLTIRHVGNPRKRMPVRRVKTAKSPNHIAEIQTCADVNVLGDIWAVIQREELMMRDRTIQQQSREYKQCTQQDRFLAQIVNESVQNCRIWLCHEEFVLLSSAG